MVFGTLSLVLALGLAGLVAWSLGPGNRDKIDSASVQDVSFLLNSCGLGDSRIEKVLHSYRSSRSFNGDHIDAFAIKVSGLDFSGLALAPDHQSCWYRGDRLPLIAIEAVDFVDSVPEISWFPKAADLKSAVFYVHPENIDLNELNVLSTELIFVRPSDNMIFYVGVKT